MKIILAILIIAVTVLFVLVLILWFYRPNNELKGILELRDQHFYKYINMCRDEIKISNDRVEYFENTLVSVVQNIGQNPLYYNQLYAESNGTKQFNYLELSKLVSDYDAYKQSKKE